MMPSFPLAALTALELAPPELIEVAAACGYDHVGLRLLPAMPGGAAYPLMEDDAALRDTIARLAATGVTVADLEVVAIRPETEIAAAMGTEHYEINAYEAAIRLADALGADGVGGRLRANLEQEVAALEKLGKHADRLAKQAVEERTV